MRECTWPGIRDRKQEERRARIPKEWLIGTEKLPADEALNVLEIPRTCGILTAREVHITEDLDASSLVAAIRKCRFSAVEVTVAFCKRAAIAQQLTNCLTEPLFDSALARAHELDHHLRTTGNPLGPLHGLCISLKDTFHIRNVDSSIGIASLAFQPAERNAPLVDILLAAGAVIHCKTNVPQTLNALDSVNNLFGRTLNPYNRRDVTAGGSSGGEGVLVAMKGCVMGVGTDVGGSIRIPAMCNGVVGFKPSRGRVPFAGQEGGQLPSAGMVGMQACAGPICRGLDDVRVFFDALEAATPWEVDPAVVPGKCWGSDIQKEREPLIGVLWRDGVIEPLPPVMKVLQEVVEKLKVKGVEVVEMQAPRFKECNSLANAFFGVEGGNHMFDLLEQTGEPLIPWLESRLRRKKPKSVDELRKLHARKLDLETDFMEIWKDSRGRTIDAFICPIAPHPVPPIDRWNGLSYTSSFVLLDYPAGTLPVRLLRHVDLDTNMTGETLSSWDRVNRELWNKETIEREVYLNTPLSIQIVAPKLQEMRLYNAMQIINDAIHAKPAVARL